MNIYETYISLVIYAIQMGWVNGLTGMSMIVNFMRNMSVQGGVMVGSQLSQLGGESINQRSLMPLIKGSGRAFARPIIGMRMMLAYLNQENISYFSCPNIMYVRYK